jgi:hypothetical protein
VRTAAVPPRGASGWRETIKEYRKVYFLPVEPGVGFAFVRLDPKDETTGSLGFTALGFLASRLPRLFSFDMVFPR